MSMFDTSRAVKTKTTKAKKAEKAEVVISGIEGVAALDTVIKSLTAVKDTMSAAVKQEMQTIFIQNGLEEKRRPVSFRGTEGSASASCELRARASTSVPSEEELEVLNRYQIPTEETTSVVDTFVFNPAYLEDTKMMAKIEAALKTVKGIPEDLFLHQEGKSKIVVSDNALDVLFTKSKAVIEEVFPFVGVLALKPKMDEDDFAKTFAIVEGIVGKLGEDA